MSIMMVTFLLVQICDQKLFGIEVEVKDLKALKTAPFRFIKELVSYPYKNSKQA